MVIGLDSMPFSLLDLFQDDLPNFRRLRDEGASAILRSVTPPITIPAWMCMMTGRDPGEHGVYGFRNRTGAAYGTAKTVSSASFSAPAVWDVLSAAGRPSVVVGVPGTYPLRPLVGTAISDFLTPEGAPYTYPLAFAGTVEQVVGNYLFDVPEYRSVDLRRVEQQAFIMTERRFTMVDWMQQNLPWDFLMMVEIGLDRMHHVFWNHMDEHHPLYVPDSPFKHSIHRYYRFLDQKLGHILQTLPEDVLLLVVSDHGAHAMDGGVFLNDWLRREGYLTMLQEPQPGERFDTTKVDWSRTTAWAEGGYYGRVYLNVAGREEQGTVAAADFPRLREQLAARLEGELQCGATVFTPEATYRKVSGVAPDLIVYLGDLRWRALASVGHPDIYTTDNDTGPDGANHAQDGVFMAYRPGYLKPSLLPAASLLDVAHTILTPLGLAAEVPGRDILKEALC